MKPASLKIKLTFALIGLGLSSVILLAVVVFFYVISQTKSDYLETVDQQLMMLDQRVFDYARTIASNTKMLSEIPLIQEADERITTYVDAKSATGLTPMVSEYASDYEQAVYGLLKAFQSNHSSVKNASVGVEVNGGFVKYPPSDRFNGYDARQRDWYIKALERPNEVVISEIYTTSSDEDVILCVKTIYDTRGQLRGVVTVDFDLLALSEAINYTKIGSSGYVILTDSLGNILAHPKNSQAIGRHVEALGLKSFDDLSLDGEVIKIQEDAYWVQKRASSLAEFPLYYVVVIDESSFYESGFAVLNRTFFVMLILVGLMIIVSRLLAVNLLKPLEQLKNMSFKIARGDFKGRLDLNRQDEIGALAHQFNSMADALEISRNTLEKKYQKEPGPLVMPMHLFVQSMKT